MNLLQLTAMIVCLAMACDGATQVPAAPQPGSETPQQAAPEPVLTMFPHPEGARLLVSGQANVIFQSHPPFHSPYSGDNSLLARGEYKVSMVGTLFTGFQLRRDPSFQLDALYDLESSAGRGISEALGLAGFTNLDVVRNPQLGPVPYTARAQLHAAIGLSSHTVAATRTPYSLATTVAARRIDLRAGRMSLPDMFDTSGPGSDSHLQFLNWTVDNNGAYDYAADTRGYTYGAVAEYDDGSWTARYGLALMPTVANGIDLEWNLHRARGENFELDWNHGPASRWLPNLRGSEGGAVRLLAFVNHANMGVYRAANQTALAARAAGDPQATPDITAHPFATTVKYGFGLNLEQPVTERARLFARAGWNEGQHESFAYSEVDETFEVGGDLAGARWGRPNDKWGIVGVTNAIKRDHQQYLALGGRGFLLGDGRLHYGREDILESYYNAHVGRGLFTAFDVQLIAHPGYNVDRGPVAVFSVRTHLDF